MAYHVLIVLINDFSDDCVLGNIYHWVQYAFDGLMSADAIYFDIESAEEVKNNGKRISREMGSTSIARL